ncbi:hypothetical protein R5H32_04605 [Defluviimonas sp. D31]|nr:hypothetical protein [Defluviimonas sp. D31]
MRRVYHARPSVSAPKSCGDRDSGFSLKHFSAAAVRRGKARGRTIKKGPEGPFFYFSLPVGQADLVIGPNAIQFARLRQQENTHDPQI